MASQVPVHLREPVHLQPVSTTLQLRLSLQPGFRNGSYDCKMKLEVDGITPPRGLWSFWEHNGTADRVTEAICIAVQKELSWTLKLYLRVNFNRPKQREDRWVVYTDLGSDETYSGLALFDYEHWCRNGSDGDYDEIVITGDNGYTWGYYID